MLFTQQARLALTNLHRLSEAIQKCSTTRLDQALNHCHWFCQMATDGLTLSFIHYTQWPVTGWGCCPWQWGWGMVPLCWPECLWGCLTCCLQMPPYGFLKNKEEDINTCITVGTVMLGPLIKECESNIPPPPPKSSWNALKLICDIYCSQIWAELSLLSLSCHLLFMLHDLWIQTHWSRNPELFPLSSSTTWQRPADTELVLRCWVCNCDGD